MMARKATRRRSPHEGGAYSYKTKAGERWYWKATLTQPDGITRPKVRRGFETRKVALDDMRDKMVKAGKGELVDPSKQLTGQYLATWLDGLRLGASTVASYRKNVRLHLTPYIGEVPLASLTSTRLTKLYTELEASGRRNHKGERTGEGLSARTVRYIHTIIGAALSAAVDAEPPLLSRSPADRAKPPTAAEAAPPEMHPWSAAQLSAFLNWSAERSPLHTAWWVLAHTGMRRGELLALCWRDVDLDSGTIAIRRSAGVIRVKGQGAVIKVSTTKNKQSRVIDVDPVTMTLLRAWKRERGSLALVLARDDSLVFGDLEGGHLHPERFSRTFKATLTRCGKALGDGAPPMIRLHDLRHTHATLLLSDGEPVKTVSERLGHKSVTITLTVYGHVMPGDQKRAASRFAALVKGA